MGKESQSELVNRVNRLISHRTSYGLREGTAEAPGIVISWSNGSADWWPSRRVKKGEHIRLDANQVFIPKTSLKVLKSVLDENLLAQLPLYGGSFERMQAGTPDYVGNELPPMIRVVRDGDYPRPQDVDDALLRKAQEN